MPASLVSIESPYKEIVTSFFKKFDGVSQKSSGGLLKRFLSPERVAEKILQVVESKNPSLHNRVGVDGHVYFYAKRILPAFIWHYILQKSYGISK